MLAEELLVGIRAPSLHRRRRNGQNQRRDNRMRRRASMVCIRFSTLAAALADLLASAAR